MKGIGMVAKSEGNLRQSEKDRANDEVVERQAT
jgi:hypothetical protein